VKNFLYILIPLHYPESSINFFLTTLTNELREQSISWEVNGHSASQEIPRILWNSKVHYRVHKNPPLAPILSHMNPLTTLQNCFAKLFLILSSHPLLGISSCLLHVGLPTKILSYHISSSIWKHWNRSKLYILYMWVPVTTAWSVLVLRLEVMASRYGG